jgi:tetratricopeptide (TPR) repeat protein
MAWGTLLWVSGDARSGIHPMDETVRLAPDDPYPFWQRSGLDSTLDQEERTVSDFENVVRLLNGPASSGIRKDALESARTQISAITDDMLGAFEEAVPQQSHAAEFDYQDYRLVAPISIVNELARAHDLRAARAQLQAHPFVNDLTAVEQAIILANGALPIFFLHAEAGDWAAAAASLESADRKTVFARSNNDIRHTLLWPWLAYAWAKAGHLKASQALIALTPEDCTRCLELRGRIVDIAGDTRTAAYWYGRTVMDAPSIPFAYADWGAMLLHKGDYDPAIDKFTLANQKGPHFADPLEMWGEALMLKNRSDLALVKFEDANKYAPNWGRLHMKWGEALGYVGRKDEARAQFRIASTLDLGVADKAELARDMRG